MKGYRGIMTAVAAAIALAGCSSDFYDSRVRGYQPELPDQVYPIQVASGTVKLQLPLNSSRLTMKEQDAVRRLARQAVLHNAPVIVERPARSTRGEVKAAEVVRLLVDNGILPERIRSRTGAAGMVVISYDRKFAVTRECGDWSRPVTRTGDNAIYPNFGCAQQHNIAAMVDNPEDFERPRVMTPPDADLRNRAMAKYRKGEDYTSQWPAGSKIRIDDGLKAVVRK